MEDETGLGTNETKKDETSASAAAEEMTEEEDFIDEAINEVENIDQALSYDDAYWDVSSYVFEDDTFESSYWDYNWDSVWGDYG